MLSRKPRIFIADDNPDILAIMQLMLQTRGYDVTTSINGAELFQYNIDELPDLILLDIWMSGIDGREICTRLKQSELTKQIPVFFVSANSNISDITKTYCADGFIAKPFEMDQFLSQVNSVVPA